MIQFEKITLQIGQKLFTQSTKKFLRIQTTDQLSTNSQSPITIKTQSASKPISPTSLEWDQVIELPLIYNKQISFQIYDKHEFGYNPEQLTSVMHGKIVVDDDVKMKFFNWEVYDSNDKKMGYLSANVKARQQKSVEKLNSVTSVTKKKVTDQTQLVVISSIVVNIPSIKTKHAYALVSVGQKKTRTSAAKSKSGQLVFVQKYQLQKHPAIQQGIIYIFSCETDGRDEKIATAKIKLEKRIDRRLKFFDAKDLTREIGEGFVDGKISLKSEVMSDRIFANIVKQGIKNQFSSTQNNANNFNTLSRSVIMTNRTFANTHAPSLSPFSSTKKFSVLNRNMNIKIPQQKRFSTTNDPANNKCSYLSERSFEFKQKNVDKYYRGASIGYGRKADFTKAKKEVPCVGKYHLPSIWDRY